MSKYLVVFLSCFCIVSIGIPGSLAQTPQSKAIFYVPTFKHPKEINPRLAKKITDYFVDTVFAVTENCDLMDVFVEEVQQSSEYMTIKLGESIAKRHNVNSEVLLEVPRIANVFVLGFIEYDPFSNETKVFVYVIYKNVEIISRGVNVSYSAIGNLMLEVSTRSHLLQPIAEKIFQKNFLVKLLKMTHPQLDKTTILNCISSRSDGTPKRIDIPGPKNYSGKPIQLTIGQLASLEIDTTNFIEKAKYVLFLGNTKSLLYKYLEPISRQNPITRFVLHEYDKVVDRENTQLVIAKVSQADFNKLRDQQVSNITFWKKGNLPSMEVIQRIPLFIHKMN